MVKLLTVGAVVSVPPLVGMVNVALVEFGALAGNKLFALSRMLAVAPPATVSRIVPDPPKVTGMV